MEKWKLLLSSRKFWAALVGLAVLTLKAWKPDFPVEAEELAGLLSVLAAYILGTALEDGLRAARKG